MTPIQFTKAWIRYVYERAGRHSTKIRDAITAAAAVYDPLATKSTYFGVDTCALDREIAWFSPDRTQVFYHNSENGPFRVIPYGEDQCQIDLAAPIDDGKYRAVGDVLFAEFKEIVISLSLNTVQWNNQEELRGVMDVVLRRSIEKNWEVAFKEVAQKGLQADEKGCVMACAKRCLARLDGGKVITVPVLLNAFVESALVGPSLGLPPGRVCVPG